MSAPSCVFFHQICCRTYPFVASKYPFIGRLDQEQLDETNYDVISEIILVYMQYHLTSKLTVKPHPNQLNRIM